MWEMEAVTRKELERAVFDIHRKYNKPPHEVYISATDSEKVSILELMILEDWDDLSNAYSIIGSLSMKYGGLGGVILRRNG